MIPNNFLGTSREAGRSSRMRGIPVFRRRFIRNGRLSIRGWRLQCALMGRSARWFHLI